MLITKAKHVQLFWNDKQNVTFYELKSTLKRVKLVAYLWSYASCSVLVLRQVSESSWNLSTFSLLLEKSNYKNPRNFLYRFEHAKIVFIIIVLSVAQFPAISSEEFHFKMLSRPVHDVRRRCFKEQNKENYLLRRGILL